MELGYLIEVENLHYRYADGTAALQGVDFRLSEGETAILLGPNGSGKTSFLLHLNGLLHGEGRVRVCGLEVEPSHYREVRRQIGFVFQDADEQLFMPTVLEDVSFGLLNQGLSPAAARERAMRALEEVGMAHAAEKAPYHLSGGEKRKVALAGVLVMEPKIIILDEPTTSLDPPSQRDLLRHLGALPQAKVIATHDASFARALGTRALFFYQGRIASQGSVEQIIRHFHWDVNDPISASPAPLSD